MTIANTFIRDVAFAHNIGFWSSYTNRSHGLQRLKLWRCRDARPADVRNFQKVVRVALGEHVQFEVGIVPLTVWCESTRTYVSKGTRVNQITIRY